MPRNRLTSLAQNMKESFQLVVGTQEQCTGQKSELSYLLVPVSVRDFQVDLRTQQYVKKSVLGDKSENKKQILSLSDTNIHVSLVKTNKTGSSFELGCRCIQ